MSSLGGSALTKEEKFSLGGFMWAGPRVRWGMAVEVALGDRFQPGAPGDRGDGVPEVGGKCGQGNERVPRQALLQNFPSGRPCQGRLEFSSMWQSV